MDRKAFSLVELLVLMFVVALLSALLLGAIQSARESARRSHCAANLHQIGVAMQSYHDAYAMFPLSAGYSYLTALQPYMELEAVYQRVDFVKRMTPANSVLSETPIEGYRCSSDGVHRELGATNYGANFGSGAQAFGFNGLFRFQLMSAPQPTDFVVRAADVRDGLSNTAAVGEILVGNWPGPFDELRSMFQTPIALTAPNQLDDFAAACASLPALPTNLAASRGLFWMYSDPSQTGYNHVLTPNQRSCQNGSSIEYGAYTAASVHPNGINLLFADGHVTFENQDVERSVWRAIGSRAGGEVYSD